MCGTFPEDFFFYLTIGKNTRKEDNYEKEGKVPKSRIHIINIKTPSL
jgi:hypothetical protein